MKQLLLLFLLALPCYAFSQSNYHAGSVTITNDKVLTGYIDYREWVTSPESINFKTNLDDKKPVVYYPASIQSFTVDGLEKYYSYKGKISLNKINFPDLATGKDTSSKDDVVFFKMIATGPYLTLLSYTDGIKTRYFIQEQNQHPSELNFQRYYNGINTDIKMDNKYIGQLSYFITKYAQSDARIFNKVQDTHYEEDAISDIVNMINGVNKTARVKVITHDKLSSFRFFAGAGLSVANSSFHHEIYMEHANSTTYAPHIDFGIDAFINPSVQKLIFRLDVGLDYIKPVLKADNSFTTVSATNYTISANYNYNQYNLKIAPQVIFNLYNANKLKIYIDAGVMWNISKYSNQSYTISRHLPPEYNEPPVTVFTPYQLSSWWIDYSFQTGVVFNKHIELFLNYTPYSNYIDDTARAGNALQTGITAGTTYYNAGVHYLFGNKGKKAK